jgi:hypothetical protein
MPFYRPLSIGAKVPEQFRSRPHAPLLCRLSLGLNTVHHMRLESWATADTQWFAGLDVAGLVGCGSVGGCVHPRAVMQAGFAMLEAGSVSDSAVTNILFKVSEWVTIRE